jgi:hypothetical protein
VAGEHASPRPGRVAARVGRITAGPGLFVEVEDHLGVGELAEAEGGVRVHHGWVEYQARDHGAQ